MAVGEGSVHGRGVVGVEEIEEALGGKEGEKDEEGGVGEGGEHWRDGSTEGVAGEVEVGEAPEAVEGCRDVANEGVPSKGEHQEASGAAKEEGDDAGDEERSDGGNEDSEEDEGTEGLPVEEGAVEDDERGVAPSVRKSRVGGDLGRR